jgi:hypothetical protein
MTSDPNASALDAGFETTLAFVDLAPIDRINQYADKLFSNVVEKSFGARPSTVAK